MTPDQFTMWVFTPIMTLAYIGSCWIAIKYEGLRERPPSQD